MSGSAPVRILLLRGINLGGRNRLPMADLRALLTGLGLSDVQTHIQSGNAVFRGPAAGAALAAGIVDAIDAAKGFRPEALVLDIGAVDAILGANPYRQAGDLDGADVQIGFLQSPALQADLDALNALAAPDERFALTPAAFYLHAPSGIGRSKLAARAERLLGVPMTMRNHRVTTALAALARQIS
ncbi:MAG: DUF1697 domain-containing protein [Pararhodobacter sp.]|nr:DUF1697 domain-containing protein [Pararhodobacter sp.]